MRMNDPIETCEQLVTNMPNSPAFEQSDKAWYSPSNDVVGMAAASSLDQSA
jgi:antirestriction protein ArdC